jgi:hypothetical protein
LFCCPHNICAGQAEAWPAPPRTGRCNLRQRPPVGWNRGARRAPADPKSLTAMSPTKTILRELQRAHADQAGAAFVRPAAIPGFAADPDRYQKAVNELLKDRLIEGRRDEEGRMAVALNAHRLSDVRRRLRPAWAHPAVWAAVAVMGALGAGLML